MRISKHPQGSVEWKEERKGIPTASEFAPFMIEQKTAAAKSAHYKYLCGKITDNAENDEYEQAAEDKAERFMDNDPWVQRGKYLEPIAREALSKKIGLEIVETGLIFHSSEQFAASPDGLIVGDDGEEWAGGCEIKCHNRKRHLADLLKGLLPEDHKYQVHGCMIVTGLRVWHYFGYHPAYPPLHVVVERDDFTNQLERGLIELVAEKKRIETQLYKLWERKFENA